MRICDHDFTSATIQRIQSRIDSEPGISRRQLSREVCHWENWRSPNGKLKTQSCRKSLAVLDQRGLIRLPEVRTPAAFLGRNPRDVLPEDTPPEIECALRELGEIDLIEVPEGNRRLSRVWDAMMDQYHPRGSGPLCGAQIRYLAQCEQGWVGGLSFNSATWRLKERDRLIGWSEAARRANLPMVIRNSRFLIPPMVRVPHLASHLLGRCRRQLPADWRRRYGITPALMETFVDEVHDGVCYRAAQWRPIGRTASRPTPFPNGKIPDGRKTIYLRPLRKDWQRTLCAEPKVALQSWSGLDDPSNWVEEELGAVRLNDERLRKRLFQLTMDFYRKPRSMIAAACDGDYVRTKAAYRFFDHRSTNMEVILTPHKESTIERMKDHAVVLAAQDTTILNYAGHPPSDAGPINNKKDKARGFILHDTVAFTEQGVPLGVLDAQFWARDSDKAGISELRHDRPVSEKESRKWLESYRAVSAAQALCPDTMVVSVSDRESDIYELFDEARRTENGAKLLVRADKARNRSVERQKHGGEWYERQKLWDRMERMAPAGELVVEVPRRGKQPGRRARVSVRFAEVTLRAPTAKTRLGPISLWAVYVTEIDPGPDVTEPLEWMLLTDVETLDFHDACVRIRWYCRRWGVEVYHRTLKSCCRILERRLERGYRLETCLGLDMVVAWRIYWALRLGREMPDASCALFLEDSEWKALWAYFYRRKPLPSEPPSCKAAVTLIAKLGGFLGRKSDGYPGNIHMAQGFQRLSDIAWTFEEGYKRPP